MSRLFTLASLLLITACATTGSTFGSGVGDRMLEHPPYYAGSRVPDSARIVLLPLAFERGASQPEIFDPSSASGSPAAALIREMQAFLDSVSPLPRVSHSPAGIAPKVYFGCELDAATDCVQRGDSVLGRDGTTMRLELRRPSAAWIAGAQALMDSANATHALLVTLEVGQYWVRQSGLRGAKSVELGTGHVVSLPWLTSLEKPVSVLQLTGALIGRDGRGVRVGAEGILARRSSIVESGFGLQRLISDEDVQLARTAVRGDLAGTPRAWEVALCELLRGLIPAVDGASPARSIGACASSPAASASSP